MAKEENAFLKSRIDMAVRKLGTKDEQIKKLRDKLEELQPGSSTPLLAAVREPSGSNGGSQLSVGSPPSHGLLSPSASASGTSTPTSEVEKETAEWLGTVFKVQIFALSISFLLYFDVALVLG